MRQVEEVDNRLIRRWYQKPYPSLHGTSIVRRHPQSPPPKFLCRLHFRREETKLTVKNSILCKISLTQTAKRTCKRRTETNGTQYSRRQRRDSRANRLNRERNHRKTIFGFSSMISLMDGGRVDSSLAHEQITVPSTQQYVVHVKVNAPQNSRRVRPTPQAQVRRPEGGIQSLPRCGERRGGSRSLRW